MDLERLKKLAGISDEDKKREEVAVSGVPHDNILDKIVEFIKRKDCNVTPREIAALGAKLKMNEEKIMATVMELLCALLKGVGKHKDVPDTEFDQAELEKGVQVEKEHTNDAYVAKLIAKDHLKEMPDYYTRLTKMEKGTE